MTPERLARLKRQIGLTGGASLAQATEIIEALEAYQRRPKFGRAAVFSFAAALLVAVGWAVWA